jgi:hypothetical protein
MRNCSRHTLYSTVKHSCPNVIEWFDGLLSGYISKFIKQFCVSRANNDKTVCYSLEKFDENNNKQHTKEKFKSILPAIVKILLTIDI